jgi:hypothetical protein
MSATSEHPDTAVALDRGAGGSTTLTIAHVNPLDHGEAIKRLFLAHDRPEFPEYFERAYPDAVADGATSWIGCDEYDRVYAHIAQFPRAFVFGQRVVQGALLANLMVATAHRTFWPALALARRVVKDLKGAGGADFVYADPNDQARPVLLAAGFRSIGVLRRFVLPLTDARRSLAVGIRLHHLLLRLRTTPLVVIDRAADQGNGMADRLVPGDLRSLRPVRRASLYRGRLAGYPSASDRWYTFHAPSLPDVSVGEALVRGQDRGGAAMVCVVQCEPTTHLSSVLVALARRLRDTGATRLEIWVMHESQAANAVRRAGFLSRPERIPLLALPLTALGTEAMAAGREWQFMPIDLDR